MEEQIVSGQFPGDVPADGSPTVVMIQCVDSRNAERPYCSRICCGQAIKNALRVKVATQMAGNAIKIEHMNQLREQVGTSHAIRIARLLHDPEKRTAYIESTMPKVQAVLGVAARPHLTAPQKGRERKRKL